MTGGADDLLMWTYVENGEEVISSESPAVNAAERMPDVATLFRALELPGEPSDYHYALTAAQGAVMDRRDRHQSDFTAVINEPTARPVAAVGSDEETSPG